MRIVSTVLLSVSLLGLGALIGQSQDAPPAAAKKKGPPRPPPPGVSTPGVKRALTTITPVAVFTTGGTPDWQVLTDDAVWVANGPMNSIHRLDINT
ncbi:MAG TPA: hypothetical protein VG273_15090, partial [Bryobacteraceae bacterium]|nr:hypothetical protein [Bryobacteraceae bacterium]